MTTDIKRIRELWAQILEIQVDDPKFEKYVLKAADEMRKLYCGLNVRANVIVSGGLAFNTVPFVEGARINLDGKVDYLQRTYGDFSTRGDTWE